MAASKKPPKILLKNRSWTQDIDRDTEWEKLKIKQRRCYLQRSLSVNAASEFDVTDEDINELRACFDLGFGFDPKYDLDPKLKRAFPALELYTAVNRRFNNGDLPMSSSIASSDSSSSSSDASSRLIVDPSDDPKKVKLRLKHWAQVVACSIRVACTKPIISNVADQ